MKKMIFIPLMMIFMYNSSAADQVEIAGDFLRKFFQGKTEEVYSMLDSASRAQISFEQMDMIYNQITFQFGEMKGFLEPIRNKMGENTVFVIPIILEKGALDGTVSVRNDGVITGFYLAPRSQSMPYVRAEYVDTTKYKEIDTEFTYSFFPIPGTLSLPKDANKTPAVILVHGSGPHDRDESIGPNKVFKDIALGLSSNGIAVLRYDKRTFAHATIIMEHIDELDLNFEAVEDAAAAVDYLYENSEKYNIDKNRIFVLGHSLGGSIITRIHKKQPKIKGFISLAGTGRKMNELLVDQYNYLFSLDGEISPEEENIIKDLKKKLQTAYSPELNLKTDRDSLPLGLPPVYWIDFRTLDGRTEFQKVDKPILVLQAERDYQVTEVDFKIIKEALKDNKQAKFISYPGLNHLFLYGENKSNPNEYYIPGNVDKRVIEDIVNWIKNNK